MQSLKKNRYMKNVAATCVRGDKNAESLEGDHKSKNIMYGQ